MMIGPDVPLYVLARLTAKNPIVLVHGIDEGKPVPGMTGGAVGTRW